jgi:hypothetical protein
MSKILLFFALFLLFACKTIEPLAPIKSVKAIPEIGEVNSTINIPIEISLKSQLEETEKALPKTFEGKEQQCDGVSFEYKFNREPIDFQFKKSSIYYEVDGKFQLKLNYCPSCVNLFGKESCTVPRVYASCGANGEPMRKVTVGYNSEITLNSNYKFQSKTELKKFDIHDPCEITVFKYDATGKVKKEVKKQLENLEKDIDKQIEAINIKSQLEEAWSELQKPMAIDKYGFLYLKPNSISMSDLKFENKKVRLNLSLNIAPFVSTDPVSLKNSNLPNLTEYKNENGFDLTLDIRSSYDSLSSFVNSTIKGYVFEFKNKKITVQSLQIEGAQESKILFKMTFDGAKKGVLFLTGIPKIDSIKQQLYMENVEFDVKTKSLLLKSAKWLFSDRVTSELQKNAVFDMKSLIADAKNEINKQLNTSLTKGVLMSGNLDKMIINELFLDEKNLVFRSKLNGYLKLKIE